MKWLIPVIAIVVLMWLVSSFLGTQLFALNTILLVLFGYLLAAKFNILPKMLALPISAKMMTPLLVVVFLAAFFTGALGVITPLLTMEGLVVAVSGTAAGVQITGVPVVSVECPVTEELLGKASTITINAYDKASNTPYSAAVDNTVYLEEDGAIVSIVDTSATTTTAYSVGDVVTFRGGSSSYYLADKTICIDKVQMPIELDSYAVATVAGMEISCYDETGSAACTAAGNTSQEDFVIALGANGEKVYYAKLETAIANKAFNLYAQALVTFNDIKEVKLEGPDSGDTSGWTTQVLADFLDTMQFCEDDAGSCDTGGNLTGGFDKVYTRDAGPMLMLEWDSAKYKYRITASATDPTASNADFTTSDIAIICYLDAIWSRGADGELYLDYHDHGDSESNVGLDEDLDFPVTTGTAADICLTVAGS